MSRYPQESKQKLSRTARLRTQPRRVRHAPAWAAAPSNSPTDRRTCYRIQQGGGMHGPADPWRRSDGRVGFSHVHSLASRAHQSRGDAPTRTRRFMTGGNKPRRRRQGKAGAWAAPTRSHLPRSPRRLRRPYSGPRVGTGGGGDVARPLSPPTREGEIRTAVPEKNLRRHCGPGGRVERVHYG